MNHILIVKLKELKQIFLPSEDLTDNIEIKLLRSLRPASNFEVFSSVAKKRLQTIISSASSHENDKICKLVSFQNTCDALLSTNPKQLNAFLLLFESLVNNFSASTKISTFSVSSFESINTNNQELFLRLSPQCDSSVKTSSLKNRDKQFWISRETEVEIIRSLLYTFQGINSQQIKYDHKSECYFIDPRLHLSTIVRDLVLSLCELGWLFKYISNYIDGNESHNKIPGGLFVQSLCYSIKEELQDYYRLLAVLEQQIDMTATNNLNCDLTLIKLKSLLQEPIERMCLLAQLVFSATPLHGGALLSRLHGYVKHGDIRFSSVAIRIVRRVSKPFYQFIHRWIFYGELSDSYEEFFVCARADVESIQNLWNDSYYLESSLIPSFMSHDLAKRILLIGKTINFIIKYQQLSSTISSQKNIKKGLPRPTIADVLGQARFEISNKNILKHCVIQEANRRYSTQSKSVELEINHDNIHLLDIIPAEMENEFRNLEYGCEETLDNMISRARHVECTLLDLMVRKFYLYEHLLALKKFMLLGQGDFITCLMDMVGPELQKPPSKLYRHNLSGILEGALRNSNAQYEPLFILNRIVVRILEALPSDSGWEVFTLDYTIDAPLNIVIHSDAVSKYRMAFIMLWRLKRVEWTLSTAFKQSFTLSHSSWRGYGSSGKDSWRKELPKLLPVLHRCNLSRTKMCFVVQQLSNYLMFEVLESAWETLKDAITKAQSIDDIICAHDLYLNDILNRGLLTQVHETLSMQIQLLLQSIFRFCHLESALLTDAAVAMSRKRLEREELTSNISSEYVILNYVNTYDGVAEHMVTRVDEAVNDFSNQFDSLMLMLQKHSEQSGDFVKFLNFRFLPPTSLH